MITIPIIVLIILVILALPFTVFLLSILIITPFTYFIDKYDEKKNRKIKDDCPYEVDKDE